MHLCLEKLYAVHYLMFTIQDFSLLSSSIHPQLFPVLDTLERVSWHIIYVQTWLAINILQLTTEVLDGQAGIGSFKYLLKLSYFPILII